MRAMERIGVLVGVFAFTMATIYGFWTSSTTSASSGSASSASSSAGCSGS